MVIEIDQNVLKQLLHKGYSEIQFDGSIIKLHYSPVSSRLQMRIQVYQNPTYLPPSVKNCLSSSFPGPQTILPVRIFYEEGDGAIHLEYAGKLPSHQDELSAIVQEFSLLALDWKSILDEEDGRDVVYIFKD